MPSRVGEHEEGFNLVLRAVMEQLGAQRLRPLAMAPQVLDGGHPEVHPNRQQTLMTAYEGEEFPGFLALQHGGAIVGLQRASDENPAYQEGPLWQFARVRWTIRASQSAADHVSRLAW